MIKKVCTLYIGTPYFNARPQFTHFILHKPKKVFLTLKEIWKMNWFALTIAAKSGFPYWLLNKVDFENIKTQIATLKRLTEKQYKKVCPPYFYSSYCKKKYI